MAVSKNRIALIGIAAISGIAVGLYGQPLVHGNTEAVNIIVTTFSILAGFLVAIITILGDPGIMARASWRAGEVRRGEVYKRIVRQKWLFITYLLILGTALAASLLSKESPFVSIILEHVYLGLAVFAFILSLGLPATLMAIQLGRLEELIETRRKQAGIKSDQESK